MEGEVQMGAVSWSAQTFFVLGTCAALIVGLWVFFGKTLYGRALRATAVNRRGARQIGRASCRERACQYVLISVVAVSFKNKNTHIFITRTTLSNTRHYTTTIH